MISNLLIFLVTVISEPATHDYQFGHFTLSREGVEIKLFARLDRDDFLEAISDCTKDQAKCATLYFKEHLVFSLDGQKCKYKYLSHELQEEFIEFNFSLGKFNKQVVYVQVFSDMLSEINEDQESVIVSTLQGKKRSFRLGKDRYNTVIKY